jgi:amidase
MTSLSACEIAAMVRAGKLRAVDVVSDALARAEGDPYNAVVTINNGALDAAATVDAAIVRGDDPGPLAGVPFTAKDTIATAGVRTTAGSRLFATHVPRQDAPCVARLRAAGAVLVGKTNCPEFALQPRTENLLFGATQHPFVPGFSPGGSSGGCAVAVAAGIVPLSIGGDYGGSIRYPAGVTGIYGFRPAIGTIDSRGTLPAAAAGTPRARFQTVGPLVRTVDDLALVLPVLGVPARLGARPRLGVVRGSWAAPELAANVDVDGALFEEAAACFDAWRATDDYADLRALAAGCEDELTPHIRNLIADNGQQSTRDRDAIAADARALARAVDELFDVTPVIALPIALAGALPIDATDVVIDGVITPVDSMQFLAPARAVSLLGVPALALPNSAQVVARAGNESALLSCARARAMTR